MQQVVDDAPPAHRYFSDGFATYAQLLYPGEHTVAPGKSQTFSVEGDNAQLRHYLIIGLSLALASNLFIIVNIKQQHLKVLESLSVKRKSYYIIC